MATPYIEKLKKYQEKYWKDFRNHFLEDYIYQLKRDRNPYQNDLDEEELDEEEQQYIRSKANTAFAKFVLKKHDSFIKKCKEKGEIWVKDAYPFNRRWIANDEKIKTTRERYPKLLDVIHFIDQDGKHDESVNVKDWTTFKVETKFTTETRKYSHVIVNKNFYRRAEKKIGIKKNTMQKYLQEFTKMGILKKVGQLESRNRAMLYVDGYFRPVGNITKKERFLNQKNHQKTLRKFEY